MYRPGVIVNDIIEQVQQAKLIIGGIRARKVFCD
jgi:hypothetical protein